MTSFGLLKVRPSVSMRVAPLSLGARPSRCVVLSRRRLCQQVRMRRNAQPAVTCMALVKNSPLKPSTSKATLNRYKKAQLVEYAQSMGVDDSGTKAALTDRLLTALSKAAQPAVQTDARKAEVQTLQAEVAKLDTKLIAVTDTLAEATAAREQERQQLASVVTDMAAMRERWQADVQQVDELAVVAGSLEESERDILNLRSQQGRFEERVAMMQGLLQEREQQVGSLQAQLSEFRQPVLAMAGVSTAPVTSSESDTVTLAQPSRMSALSNASWTSDWNAAVLKNGNSSVAEMQLLTDEAFVVQPATTATPRCRINRAHTAPGLAIIAAVGAAAQRGSAAWRQIKNLLPQDKRDVADAVLAAGATALMYAIYN